MPIQSRTPSHPVSHKPTRATRATARPIPKKPATKPFLAALVAKTLPATKQPDEFTLAEFVATAAEISRPISERAALEQLNRQVKLNLLTTRHTTVEGHAARVWREVASE